MVPVADCIAATGTFLMVGGCDGWGGWRQKGVGVEDDRGCHEGKVGRRCDGRQARFDKARKENKTEKIPTSPLIDPV